MSKLNTILSIFKNIKLVWLIEVVPIAFCFTRMILQVKNNIVCLIVTIALSLLAIESKRICGAIKIHKKHHKIRYAIIFEFPFYVVNYFKLINKKKYAYHIVNDQIPITLVVLMINLLLYFSGLYGFTKLFGFSAQYIDGLNDYRFMIGFFLEAYIIFSAFYIGAYCVKEAIVKDVKVV